MMDAMYVVSIYESECRTGRTNVLYLEVVYLSVLCFDVSEGSRLADLRLDTSPRLRKGLVPASSTQNDHHVSKNSKMIHNKSLHS